MGEEKEQSLLIVVDPTAYMRNRQAGNAREHGALTHFG